MELEIGQQVRIDGLVFTCEDVDYSKRFIPRTSSYAEGPIYKCVGAPLKKSGRRKVVKLNGDALDILGAKTVGFVPVTKSDPAVYGGKPETRPEPTVLLDNTVWSVVEAETGKTVFNPEAGSISVFKYLDNVIRFLDNWAIGDIVKYEKKKKLPHRKPAKPGSDVMQKRESLEKWGFGNWIFCGRRYHVERHSL